MENCLDLFDKTTIKKEIYNEMEFFQEKASKIINCDDCPASFSSNEKLMIHKKNKHMKLICGQCSYVIFGKDKMHDHVRNHKSAACSYCGIVVKSRSLKKHMDRCIKEKKPKKGRKRHICESCGFSTDTGKRLNIHINKHEKQNKLKGLVHKCKYCNYFSERLASKKRHEKSCKANKHYIFLL